MDLRSPAFKRGLLLIGSMLAAVVLVEGAARAYLAFDPRSAVRQWEPGEPPPPPYRNAPYFTDAFMEEFLAIDTGPTSFEGRYFNVVDGVRATTHTPAAARGRVWLFGGSTMFSAEVPDSETIASHLQRLLNEEAEAYQISNQGLTAMTSVRATERLLTLDIRPRDVVVFYGGVNAVSRYVYSAESENWFVDLLGDAVDRSREFSAAAELAVGLGTRRSPPSVRDPAQLSRNVERMALLYEQAHLDAAAYVRARGARLYNFLQPQLFSKNAWTAYERSLLQDFGTAPAGMDEAFRAGYPALRQTMIRLADRGVVSFDLSDAFDGIPPGEEIYFDFCHVNHIANAIVARRIHDAIWSADASGR